MSGSAPQFALMNDSTRRRPLRALITSIWECEPAICSLDLMQISAWSNRRRPARGVAASVVVHACVACILYFVPVQVIQRLHVNETKLDHSRVVYYDLRDFNISKLVPPRNPYSMKQNATTSLAAPVVTQHRTSAPAHQTSESRMHLISRPVVADNSHQTILQAFPPELKIQQNIPTPNLIVEVPAPRFAPPVSPRPQVVPPPQIEHAGGAVIPLTPAAIAVAQPHLEAPPPPELSPNSIPGTVPPQLVNGNELASDAALKSSLTILTVDPVPLSSVIALPPGNRLGSFEISSVPQPDRPGLPAGAGDSSEKASGKHNGTVPSGGSLHDGGNSAGTGSGSGFIQLEGGNGGVAGGSLPAPPTGVIYPVKPPLPHAPGMILSAGSGGGGALRAYGILHGQRIYSIYLSMPGADWILQYCEHDGDRPATPQGGVLRLGVDNSLAPPVPLEQFDFRRNSAAGTPDRQIMLQGSLTAEGAVRDLRVLKGAGDPLDQAALEAFAHWKFKPARKAESPVALEIVVGIPVHATPN